MIFLDSASWEDAECAFATHLVSGITTNPALVAATGRPDAEVIADLCDASTGLVFYQVSGSDLAARAEDGESMQLIRLGRVGLKIPCTLENLTLAARLVKEGATVGITAIFSAAQARLAAEIGAHYILPYVNRSTRLLGDGPALVRDMRAVIDGLGARTEIIAASIKSPSEAVDTLLAGAHHLTLPWPLIQSMAHHDLSERAIADFDAAREQAAKLDAAERAAPNGLPPRRGPER